MTQGVRSLSLKYGGVIADDTEINVVTDVLMSQNWACGAITREFETALTDWSGIPHALFLNSGSSGLLAAMRCLPAGSKVLMPALQFPTLYSAAVWCGLKPVLCDISLTTLNLTAELVDKALAKEKNVSAVAFVHVAGNPAGIADVAELCHNRGLILIEDCCEAMGSLSNGKLTGTFGDVSVFSTHGAHHIVTGEGGITLTRWADFDKKMRRLRDWGRDIDGSGTYDFIECGLNLRPSDIHAALGIEQLTRLKGFTAARRRNYTALSGQLDGIGVRLPGEDANDMASWYTMPMLTSHRDGIARELAVYGIETRHLLCGNLARHRMANHLNPADYPAADEAWRDGLWLPVHPRHSEADMLTAGAITREIITGGGA